MGPSGELLSPVNHEVPYKKIPNMCLLKFQNRYIFLHNMKVQHSLEDSSSIQNFICMSQICCVVDNFLLEVSM